MMSVLNKLRHNRIQFNGLRLSTEIWRQTRASVEEPVWAVSSVVEAVWEELS